MKRLTPLVAALLFAIIPSTADARHEQNARHDTKRPIIHLRHAVAHAIERTWHYQDARHVARTPTLHLERNTHAVQKLYRLHHRWWRASVRERRAWKRYEAEQARVRAAAYPAHTDAWLCIHRYEGSWTANTGNGYYGGLQMDYGFMSHYGPHVLGYKDSKTMFRHRGTADHWTPAEQMQVAEYAAFSGGRGFYPWPNTARTCGLI